jgi:hypothetical protein
MSEEAPELAEPIRRPHRLVLLWPASCFLAVVWFSLGDPASVLLTFLALVAIGVGLPPERERWRLIAGWIGVGVVVAALGLILWSESDWNDGQSGWWLLAVLAILGTLGTFGLQLLSTLFFTKTKNVSSGSFTVALQYGAVGLAMSTALFAGSLDAPKRVHFLLERPSLEQTAQEVARRCVNDSATVPQFRGNAVSDWSCENGTIRFTAGQRLLYFARGDWGFAKSEARPIISLPETSQERVEPVTVTQIGPGWWLWKRTVSVG